MAVIIYTNGQIRDLESLKVDGKLPEGIIRNLLNAPIHKRALDPDTWMITSYYMWTGPENKAASKLWYEKNPNNRVIMRGVVVLCERTEVD